MKIIIYRRTDIIGGAEIFAESLAKELRKASFNVKLVSSIQELKNSNVRNREVIINIHSNKPSELIELIYLLKRLKRLFGVRVVVTVHGLMRLRFIKNLARNPKILIKMDEPFLEFLKTFTYNGYYLPIFLKLLRLSDYIISVSEKDTIILKRLLYGSKIATIRPFVEEKFLRMNWTGEFSDYFLYSGNPSARKGFDVMLKAYKKFIEYKYHPNKKLVITMPSRRFKIYAMRKIQKYKLEKFVKVYVQIPRNDLIKVFSKANAFIFPSILEASPLVIMEAMAIGIPIIATPAGDVEFFIKESRGGFLVPFLNSEELFKQMYYLVKMDRNNLLEISRNAKSYAIKNFSKDITIKKYIKIFHNII